MSQVLYTFPHTVQAQGQTDLKTVVKVCCDLLSVLHLHTRCHCCKLAVTVSHFSGQVSSVRSVRCAPVLAAEWLMLSFIAASEAGMIFDFIAASEAGMVFNICNASISIMLPVLVLVRSLMLL